eukprot:gene15056-6221_t
MSKTVLCVVTWLAMLAYDLNAAPANQGSDKSVYDAIEKINQKKTGLFEGDILPSELVDEITSKVSTRKRDATRFRHYLWRTRIIPFTISSEFGTSEKEAILAAIRILQEHTCLTFKNHSSEDQWVNFRRLDGCYSYVGRAYWTTGAQTISLGVGCLHQSTILHEIMHALGFWHEQSRPDRDKYIEIFWENIQESEMHNFNKYSHQKADILGTQYDYDTVMHYGKFAFSKNGKQTMKAIGSDRELGEATTLGPSDITALNALYDCASKGVSIWSRWSSYGPCDQRCYKTRQRFCSDPDLSNCGGANIHGVIEDQLKCSDAECYAPVDGHWGRWSSWGVCSTECGPGRRNRTRNCDNPESKNGGAGCQGDSISHTDCFVKTCGLGPWDCEFDGQGWCMWQNAPSNNARFQWKRTSGGTPSSNTGPSGDHTSGSGYYLFVETSSPALSGDKARLLSQEFAATEGLCMSFWYHMYGSTMGALRVFTKADGIETLIWDKHGDQGNQWVESKLKMNSSTTFKVIIEAEKGVAFLSDIAVDDIKFQDCAPKSKLEKKCGVKMKALGCFKDAVGDKLFPKLLDNHRDPINGHRGYTIDWYNYEHSLESIMCHCASRTKEQGFTYFGLSFYAECWAGPGLITYDRHGTSNTCINSTYQKCAMADDAMCSAHREAKTNLDKPLCQTLVYSVLPQKKSHGDQDADYA